MKPRRRPDGVTEIAPAVRPMVNTAGQPGEVELSIRANLEAAGRIGRYQGVLAIRLARQLDADMSRAGAQGLADQIDKLMTKALDGWVPDPPVADFLDLQADPRDKLRGRA